ncbi:RT0821/Lpp0805 family surface protein [Xanthobacter sp. DSM 24535]|uniref:RT0821/Lpp0805 family surface protein n=1 Tax=Roseixanthobacter psychrophilus TaxID=3119917 RepID=UPI0037282645
MVAVGLLGATLALSGCGSLLGMSDDDQLVTGSIKPQPVALSIPVGEAPQGIASTDWAQAKVALDQALKSREAGASMPWQNTVTGARGTSTPLGTVKDNGCRDFRIGVVDTSGEHWVQGEACRDGKGTTLSQVRVLGRA